MKNTFKSMLVFSILLLASSTSVIFAQESEKKSKKQERSEKVAALINSRHYVFEAQTVNPSGGRSRQLTSWYGVTLKGDTMGSELPYFGRAYSAPIGVSDGGINFVSTDFSYEANPAKKGGWNILIKPKDIDNAQQLTLAVSSSGQATLSVVSNNRQPISFMGIVKEGK